MSSRWHDFLDWFGIAGGVASLYGAWVAWRQRYQAQEASREAIAAERRTLDLSKGIQAQRRFAEAIFGCRRADDAIRIGECDRAREQLVNVASMVAQISGDPWSKGLTNPAEWQRMTITLTETAKSLNVLGARGPTQNERDIASDQVIHVMIQLERLSSSASKIGATHANS